MTELKPISLSQLVGELSRVEATMVQDQPGATAVLDVAQDSRAVLGPCLFVARAGVINNGLEFAKDAIARGATALMIQHGTPVPNLGVPVIQVNDVSLALSLAAEAVHGHPSRSLALLGITGTNGKTTTVSLVHAVLCSLGFTAARLGTLGFAMGEESVDSPLTTPQADVISRYLGKAVAHGASHFAMEVSSHALAQSRVDALSFRSVAFTNLTQDHLDFHGSMSAYAEAKARLFTELEPENSVVCVDDEFGQTLAKRARGRVFRVSRDPAREAEVKPVAVRLDAEGISGTIALPSGPLAFRSRLVGEHNLDNLLTTLALVESLGLSGERVAACLANPLVPGRLERCDRPGDDILVLVDYAHTPDALKRALSAVRDLVSGKVICVFGCGGDRDPTKRPKMGEAVGRAAHRAIVTNDNPRSEDPQKIAEAIEPGLRAQGIPYEVILDRAQAIERAVLSASPGDLVLIAGKGHETYQIMGSLRRDFDDRKEAARALEQRRSSGK